MKDNGIGGFFMHARGGLKTQYMSEEWMYCIDACCDEAEKLGMNAWGYDENGWPSGFAGGKLLEDIEKRIDPAVENDFLQQWKIFLPDHPRGNQIFPGSTLSINVSTQLYYVHLGKN